MLVTSRPTQELTTACPRFPSVDLNAMADVRIPAFIKNQIERNMCQLSSDQLEEVQGLFEKRFGGLYAIPLPPACTSTDPSIRFLAVVTALQCIQIHTQRLGKAPCPTQVMKRIREYFQMYDDIAEKICSRLIHT